MSPKVYIRHRKFFNFNPDDYLNINKLLLFSIPCWSKSVQLRKQVAWIQNVSTSLISCVNVGKLLSSSGTQFPMKVAVRASKWCIKCTAPDTHSLINIGHNIVALAFRKPQVIST